MDIKGLLKKIWAFITSPKARKVVETGVELIDIAEPFIKAFADSSGNTTLKSVVAGYEKYGLPVTQALQDGNLTQDEIKALAGLGVQLALEKLKGVSGTSAGLASILAFAKVRYGV